MNVELYESGAIRAIKAWLGMAKLDLGDKVRQSLLSSVLSKSGLVITRTSKI